MIRFFTLARRLPTLQLSQFHEGLVSEHAPLVRACPGFRRHCLEYRQNHAGGAVAIGSASPLEQDAARFDNCSEFRFEDADALLAAFNNEDYFRMLRPDEKRWADSSSRIAFIASESVRLRASATHAPRVKVLVLHAAEGDSASEGADPRPYGRCVEWADNKITGQVDFERARISQENSLPYTRLTMLSFATTEDAAAALAGDQGASILGDRAHSRHELPPPVAFWAREQVIF